MYKIMDMSFRSTFVITDLFS